MLRDPPHRKGSKPHRKFSKRPFRQGLELVNLHHHRKRCLTLECRCTALKIHHRLEECFRTKCIRKNLHDLVPSFNIIFPNQPIYIKGLYNICIFFIGFQL